MKKYIIQISGWNKGFKKVSSTKLFREKLGLGIREAKSNTDLILDRRELEILFNNKQKAIEFSKSMEALGAIVKFNESVS